MNERIRELADQCRTEYRDGHGGFIEQFDEEKFAELIIRKCAEVLDTSISPPSHPMNSLGYKLKEHFGVEE